MWRLYYADGLYLDGSSRDDWQDSPSLGVAGLVLPSDSIGRRIVPSDYYHWPPWLDNPFGADIWGVTDHLLEVGAIEPDVPLSSVPVAVLFAFGIKLGRMLNNSDWQQIWKRMAEDPGFPRKSNKGPTER